MFSPKKTIYALSLMVCFSLSTYSLTYATTLTASKQPVYTDSTKPIFLKAGQRIVTLTLRSNPTTGYSWFWLPGKSTYQMITPLSHRFIPAHNGLMGAPGVSIWQFKVSAQGLKVPSIMHIAMVYQRPWLLPTSEPREFTVIHAA